MENLIAQFTAKPTDNTTQLHVFIYEAPGADFQFPVYAGSSIKLAPRIDAFCQLSDAIKFAAGLVARQLGE